MGHTYFEGLSRRLLHHAFLQQIRWGSFFIALANENVPHNGSEDDRCPPLPRGARYAGLGWRIIKKKYISFRQQCCLTRGKAASPIAILSLRTCMCTRMIQTHVHTTQPPFPHHGRQIFSAMDNSQIYTHKCRRAYDNRYRGCSILRRGQHFCRVHIHNIATPARPC